MTFVNFLKILLINNSQFIIKVIILKKNILERNIYEETSI